MPQQLIYTSAPRGLVAGRSGFCVVARSETMRDALVSRLEQLSYYEHVTAGGHNNRIIHAYRVVDIRGTRFHVLSRIRDAGLDFTNRTNFLAHHLVFTPEELAKLSTAPVIFQSWNGWLQEWRGEPQMFRNEDWGNLFSLAQQPTPVPATTWGKYAGDGAKALGLLWPPDGGLTLDSAGLTIVTLLTLFAESLALLEARHHGAELAKNAWRFTFTTALQENDAPSDFLWRCVDPQAPAWRAQAAASQPPFPVSAFDVEGALGDEVNLARSGRQPPFITTQPADARITHGGSATLRVSASGVPLPSFIQWFECDRSLRPVKELTGETQLELRLDKLVAGVTRYCARVSNHRGETVLSRVAEVVVEPTIATAPVPTLASAYRPDNPAEPAKRLKIARGKKPSDDQIQRDFRDLDTWRAVHDSRNKTLSLVALVLLLLVVGGWVVKTRTGLTPWSDRNYKQDSLLAKQIRTNALIVKDRLSSKTTIKVSLLQRREAMWKNEELRELLSAMTTNNVDLFSQKEATSGRVEAEVAALQLFTKLLEEWLSGPQGANQAAEASPKPGSVIPDSTTPIPESPQKKSAALEDNSSRATNVALLNDDLAGRAPSNNASPPTAEGYGKPFKFDIPPEKIPNDVNKLPNVITEAGRKIEELKQKAAPYRQKSASIYSILQEKENAFNNTPPIVELLKQIATAKEVKEQIESDAQRKDAIDLAKQEQKDCETQLKQAQNEAEKETWQRNLDTVKNKIVDLETPLKSAEAKLSELGSKLGEQRKLALETDKEWKLSKEEAINIKNHLGPIEGFQKKWEEFRSQVEKHLSIEKEEKRRRAKNQQQNANSDQ